MGETSFEKETKLMAEKRYKNLVESMARDALRKLTMDAAWAAVENEEQFADDVLAEMATQWEER